MKLYKLQNLLDQITESYQTDDVDVNLNVSVTNLDIDDAYFCEMCKAVHLRINQVQCIAYMRGDNDTSSDNPSTNRSITSEIGYSKPGPY